MSDSEKPALRRANENPWYCLATVHGEQVKPGGDPGLARENRRSWNRWIASALSDEQRVELLKRGFSERELEPLSPDDRNAFCLAFAVRVGRENELPPTPSERIDFAHILFDRRVNFERFVFVGHADFRSAQFADTVNFSLVTFFKFADFGSATFSSAIFSAANFSEDDANFDSATFVDASFDRAKFPGFTNFRAATFSGSADFDSTEFEITGFGFTKFSGAVSFYRASFSKFGDFESAIFYRSVSFRSATISGRVDFINAKFFAPTIFAGANLKTHVPDFRGATMHDATEWHGVTWPKPSWNSADAQRQVYAYERLKQEMERLKRHEDEQKFFRRELRARRRLLWTSPWEWLLNIVYDWSSDYGNSFIRPLFWLITVYAAGTAIFSRAPLHCGAPMPIKLAAKLSFANIFVFLPDKRELMMNARMVECLSNTTQAVSAMQSLLGVVLLFLLGLAIRNRFRMK